MRRAPYVWTRVARLHPAAGCRRACGLSRLPLRCMGRAAGKLRGLGSRHAACMPWQAVPAEDQWHASLVWLPQVCAGATGTCMLLMHPRLSCCWNALGAACFALTFHPVMGALEHLPDRHPEHHQHTGTRFPTPSATRPCPCAAADQPQNLPQRPALRRLLVLLPHLLRRAAPALEQLHLPPLHRQPGALALLLAPHPGHPRRLRHARLLHPPGSHVRPRCTRPACGLQAGWGVHGSHGVCWGAQASKAPCPPVLELPTISAALVGSGLHASAAGAGQAAPLAEWAFMMLVSSAQRTIHGSAPA